MVVGIVLNFHNIYITKQNTLKSQTLEFSSKIMNIIQN